MQTTLQIICSRGASVKNPHAMHCKIQLKLENTQQQVVQISKIFKFAISYLDLFTLLYLNKMGHRLKTGQTPMFSTCIKNQISESKFQEHQAISLFHMVSLNSYKISMFFINLSLTALHLFQTPSELTTTAWLASYWTLLPSLIILWDSFVSPMRLQIVHRNPYSLHFCTPIYMIKYWILWCCFINIWWLTEIYY